MSFNLQSALRKHGITLKIVYAAVGVVFALLIAVIVILALGRREPKVPEHAIDIATVIKTEHELSTLTYEYADVGVYEDSKKVAIPLIGEVDVPLTDDRILFTYGGSIKVGFKLDDVTPKVDELTKTITIEIPEPEVLSHTPNAEIERCYTNKEIIIGTSAAERFNKLNDCRDNLRKEKEELVIGDTEIQKKAIEEYKEMCKSWLLASDAAVAEYTIQFN